MTDTSKSTEAERRRLAEAVQQYEAITQSASTDPKKPVSGQVRMEHAGMIGGGRNRDAMEEMTEQMRDALRPAMVRHLSEQISGEVQAERAHYVRGLAYARDYIQAVFDDIPIEKRKARTRRGPRVVENPLGVDSVDSLTVAFLESRQWFEAIMQENLTPQQLARYPLSPEQIMGELSDRYAGLHNKVATELEKRPGLFQFEKDSIWEGERERTEVVKRPVDGKLTSQVRNLLAPNIAQGLLDEKPMPLHPELPRFRPGPDMPWFPAGPALPAQQAHRELP